ncbi:HNH endonuclease, partial [Patescibacteria group bacterium]|nr:HNH endonuclease [Patescibacteria group bacterium]
MGWRKMKLRLSDRLFSRYIRYRDNWTCQRCGKRFEEKAQNLHNSHYWGRGDESTRFDTENCDALCSYCHN